MLYSKVLYVQHWISIADVFVVFLSLSHTISHFFSRSLSISQCLSFFYHAPLPHFFAYTHSLSILITPPPSHSLSPIHTPSEYILVEQALASATSSTHLGIALAKEAASNMTPIYHLAPPTGETCLRYVTEAVHRDCPSRLPLSIYVSAHLLSISLYKLIYQF